MVETPAEVETPEGGRERTGSDLLEQLKRIAKTLRGSTLSLEPYDPFEHDSLVSAPPGDGLQEVDRYWLNAPFAYVSIRYDNGENAHLYRVVKPELDATERQLLASLFDDVRDPLLYRETKEDPETVLGEELKARLEDYGV